MTGVRTGITLFIYGFSSVGRALVSKTRCREFEPLNPCPKQPKMKKLKLLTDLEESYTELRYKTSWPTRTQLVKSAIIVLIASIIIALIVLLMDQAVDNIMKLIYSLKN